MAKGYAVVVGMVLTLVGISGFTRHDAVGLHFSTTHNLIHLLSGLLGLLAGFPGAKTTAA